MSDCDVCIGGCDDPMEMLSEAVVTARKPHECCECRQIIAVGQPYEKHVGKYDGELLTYRTCMLCKEIREVFSCGKGWYYECLWESLRDYGFERLTTASPCFAQLSAAAKALVIERWQKWKGLTA